MCLCFLNANRNWSVQAAPKLHLFWKRNHLVGYEWRRSVDKMMKIILLPQRTVRKNGAEFLMTELILKLCLKKVPMWCNTCLIPFKAVSWCSLGTLALHLPAFAGKVSFSTAGMWYSHYTASYDTWWELILWSCWRPEASWLPEANMVICSSNLSVTEYFSVVVTYGSFFVSLLDQSFWSGNWSETGFCPTPEEWSLHCSQAGVLK